MKQTSAAPAAGIMQDYAAMRAKGYRAREAWWHAKAKALLTKHSDDIRIRLELDEEPYDLGDLFNESCNSGVSAARLARQQREFCDKLNRDGVWGYIVEYRTPQGEWEHSDSCWGFDDEEFCRESALDSVPSAIAALEAARANACPACSGTGRRA